MTDTKTIRFADLEIASPLLQAIAAAGYETPSPIQAQSIPPLLAGRDLLGQAQTGTGKTAAFSLPALSRIDLSHRQPQVLVLAPTRELAIQVAEAMAGYAQFMTGFKIATLYGGQNISTQLRQLRQGVHVVVGTPGRLIDHLKRGTLILDSLATVVLDEADEMLRMGFIEDVETILGKTPPGRQVALFSATMPAPIRRVAQAHLNNPIEIKIKAKTATVSTINQRYWQVRGMTKVDALTRIIEVEDFDAMLIFTRTKVMASELVEKLESRGYACAVLSGDVSQVLREKTVERLKAGRLDIIVATDVAARGLDVERISHVVNYDIPRDTETYVHRIGRTGRAGRSGDAILFINGRERRMLRSIEKATRQPIQPMQIPSLADIADRRIVRFKQLISDTITEQELGFFEDLIGNYQQEQDISPRQIAAALAYLAQRERPLVPPETDLRRDAALRTDDWAADLGKPGDVQMQRFRVEVGRQHGVKPKGIVGAIANEVNLHPAYIGQIKFFDDFSTIYLPQGLPKNVLEHLKKVRVCGQALQIRMDSSPNSRSHPPRAKISNKGRKKRQKAQV